MRRRIPSTQALSCFEAAARHQSFTRAAQELALSQGAVSRQVGLLERQFGVALFRRTRHGMTLTPAGREYARQVAQRLNALERDTLDLMGRGGEGDSLTLACVPTLATRWLVPRLARLAREQPQLQVHLEARSRPFLFGDSPAEAAIVALTPEQCAQWAGTRATVLFAEESVPVCSPALLRNRRRLTPREIAAMPLLQPSTRPEAWRQWFDRQGVQTDRAMAGPRYELFSMQATAAACGLGLALVPRLLVEDELASGALVVACDRPVRGERQYYFVQPELPERAAVGMFRRWLEGELAAAATLAAAARAT